MPEDVAGERIADASEIAKTASIANSQNGSAGSRKTASAAEERVQDDQIGDRPGARRLTPVISYFSNRRYSAARLRPSDSATLLMLPPWCRSDFTIIARSISSIVIDPDGGQRVAAASRGGHPAVSAKSSTSSVSRVPTSTARSIHCRS